MRRLETLIHVLIGLTLLVPIVIAPNVLVYPFVVPKILLFRGIVGLMLGAYIILAVGCPQSYRPRLSPISVALFCFFLSLALSAGFGVDGHRNFFDSIERMLGVETVAYYVVFYLITTAVVTRWTTWRTLLRFFLAVTVLVLIVGMAQAFDQVFVTGNRGWVSSTLGNSSYLGGLGGFTVCLAMLLAFQENDRSWRVEYSVAGLVGIVGVVVSHSRGALLSVVLGFGVFGLCYAVVLGQHQKLRRLAIVGAGGCTLLVVLLAAVGLQDRAARQLRQGIEADRASLLMKWADATDHPALAVRGDQSVYGALLEHIRSLDDKQVKATVQSFNAYLVRHASALDPVSRTHLQAVNWSCRYRCQRSRRRSSI